MMKGRDRAFAPCRRDTSNDAGIFRRDHRRWRAVRHRRRLSPADRLPGASPTSSSKAATPIGGTWDLFRYPGIRSDSDMYTLGYSFRPWQDASADRRRPIDPATTSARRRKRTASTATSAFGHRVSSASLVFGRRALDGRGRARPGTASRCASRATSSSLCTGYYDYAAGYTPDLPARSSFAAALVHPQHWPQDLDYARQARGGDRQRRHRRHAHPGDGRDARRT